MQFNEKYLINLRKFVKNQKFENILIISGKNSFFKSGAKLLVSKIFEPNKKKIDFYFKNSSYPEFNELKLIIKNIREKKPDLIFAIGGGSVIDYAKIANSLAYSLSIKKDIISSSQKNIKKFCPLVAIPTTAGSGAETTANAVIYLNKIKYSVESEILKPDINFLIPELVLKNKKKLKSSAGFDAISQAIESMISKKSTTRSVAFALNSLDLSLKNYLSFIKKPNLNNSYNMCRAAYLSGRAISISKTTAPHALSYPFTAHFGVSHGHAVSLTLNEFLLFNFKHIKKSNCSFNLENRFNKIFSVTRTKNINELNLYLINLKKKAGLIQNLSKFNININRDYSKIISGVNIQRLSNNPISLEKKDIKNILFEK